MSCSTLQWRHNEHNGVASHRRLDCLLNSFFQTQIEETIEAPRHWHLWGEPLVTAGLPSLRASNAENLMTSSWPQQSKSPHKDVSYIYGAPLQSSLCLKMTRCEANRRFTYGYRFRLVIGYILLVMVNSTGITRYCHSKNDRKNLKESPQTFKCQQRK